MSQNLKETSNNNIPKTQGDRTDTRIEIRTGTIPQYTKLDFPAYDDIEDPIVWLHKCERKKNLHQCTTEIEKVGLAAFHMLGEAQMSY